MIDRGVYSILVIPPSRLRTDHDQVYLFYNCINFLRPKTSKQVFLLRKTRDEFSGNSKVVDMHRNYKSVLPLYTLNEIVGIEINIYYNWHFQRSHHGD